MKKGNFINYVKNQHIILGIFSHNEGKGFNRCPRIFTVFYLFLYSIAVSLVIDGYKYKFSAKDVSVCTTRVLCCSINCLTFLTSLWFALN